MKISINIEHIQKINELKEALIYILPNQLNDINNAIYEYKATYNFKNYIVIDEDKIKCTMYCLKQSIFISEYDFIDIISILKKCDKNTYVVETEHGEFLNIFKMLDGDIDFFNKYNMIDSKTYIRNIKIKKIL